MIIKAKIKNIKIESIVAKQFEIDIEREKRNIKFLITSPVEEEIVKYCLNNINNILFLELDNMQKISLLNFVYYTEVKESKMYISLKGQFLYIGSSFVSDSPILAKKIEIVLGNERILDINQKIRKIFTENVEFKINECNIKINNENILLENYNRENVNLYELYELMWLVYGFFPPIKYIEYTINDNKIKGYIDFVYNRVSNREHFLKMNKIINIEKIDNINENINRWEKIKSKYGETFINFLFYTTSDYSKYINIQLCNLLQSIDGYTDILYCLDESDKKNKIIDNLIQYLQEQETEEDRKDIESALGSLKRLAFKKRVSRFIEEYDQFGLFKEERILEIKYKDKKNECYIFLKYNKFLNEAIEQRNALSHIKDIKEWDYLKIKMYYWKLLLLVRISLAKKVFGESCINTDNINEQCKSIYEWYIKNNKKCEECKFYEKLKCKIFMGE